MDQNTIECWKFTYAELTFRGSATRIVPVPVAALSKE